MAADTPTPLAAQKPSAKTAIQAGKDLNAQIAKATLASKRTKRVKVVCIKKGHDGLKIREPGDRFIFALIDEKKATIRDVPADVKALIERYLAVQEIEVTDENVLKRWLEKTSELPSWVQDAAEYDRQQAAVSQETEEEDVVGA